MLSSSSCASSTKRLSISPIPSVLFLACLLLGAWMPDKEVLLQGDGSALLVRRKGRAMPEELGRGGQQAEHIDWRKSVLLNLVIQATYCLTVATCR